MKRIFPFLAAIFAVVGLAGCGDGRKEPSAAAVDAANEARIRAIDQDPNLTPEQREIIKSRLGGVGTTDPDAGR